MTLPNLPCGRIPYGHSTNRRRTLHAIRKRDSDLEAQDLYSKIHRYKLEMFNFSNHPGKFGIDHIQNFFR